MGKPDLLSLHPKLPAVQPVGKTTSDGVTSGRVLSAEQSIVSKPPIRAMNLRRGFCYGMEGHSRLQLIEEGAPMVTEVLGVGAIDPMGISARVSEHITMGIPPTV